MMNSLLNSDRLNGTGSRTEWTEWTRPCRLVDTLNRNDFSLNFTFYLRDSRDLIQTVVTTLTLHQLEVKNVIMGTLLTVDNSFVRVFVDGW